jgi:O-antigen/teichoic acid export membrane protein
VKQAARDPESFLRTDHLEGQLQGRALRGGMLTLLAQVIKFVLQLANMVVLARLLSPHDFGLVGMVTSLVGFLTIFKDLGLSAATIQRPQISHAQVSNLFWINAGFGLLLCLITLGLAQPLSHFYKEASIAPITRVLALGFLVSGLGVQHQALLRRQMRFATVIRLDLIALGASTLTAIVGAWAGQGPWALVYAQLVLITLTTAGGWISCGWRPMRWSAQQDNRSMLGLGGWLASFRVVSYWIQNLDNMLIGRRWGSEALGFYMRAYQLLVMPLSQINLPLGEVAVPMLSRLQDNPIDYRLAYGRVLQAVLWLTLPVIVVTVGAADWVIEVALGRQWISAAEIFMWLGVMAFAEPIRYTTGYLFISQGRTREMFYAELVSSFFLIAAIVAGVQQGPKQVAMYFALSSLFLRTPIVLCWAGRSELVRTSQILGPSLMPMLSSLLALSAVLLLRRWSGAALLHPFLGCVLATLLCLVVFVSAMRLLPGGRQRFADLRAIPQLMRRKAKSTTPNAP